MYRSIDPYLLCTIAGLDPTGGAGLTADLRVFQALGGWGTAVATALTVQDADGVRAVEPVAPDVLGAQLRVALAERPAALKIGMLATRAGLETVADALDEAPPVPLVVDPVLAAGAGGRLLEESALEALASRLAPHATLLTPNLPEAARLLGRPPIAPGEEADAAQALCAQGWRAVLLKGGHAEGTMCVDLLADSHGVASLGRPRLAGGPLHGTGCALSAATAAHLARGVSLPAAVRTAGDWLHGLIAAAYAANRTRLAP